MLFVEFVGLPGSGKTTVARELQHSLARAGIKCLTRTRLVADDAGAVARHIRRGWLILQQAPWARRHYARAAAFVAASGQTHPVAALKVVWNLWTVLAIVIQHRRTKGAVLILDQGLAQAVWSTAIGAKDCEVGIDGWREFIEEIGVQDIGFVLLRASPEIARERLAGRLARTSRMQAEGWAGEPERWQRAETLYRHLAAQLSELALSGAAACSEIDSTACAPGAAAAVIQSRLFPETVLQEPDNVVSATAGDLFQHKLERGQFPRRPYRRTESSRL